METASCHFPWPESLFLPCFRGVSIFIPFWILELLLKVIIVFAINMVWLNNLGISINLNWAEIGKEGLLSQINTFHLFYLPLTSGDNEALKWEMVLSSIGEGVGKDFGKIAASNLEKRRLREHSKEHWVLNRFSWPFAEKSLDLVIQLPSQFQSIQR